MSKAKFFQLADFLTALVVGGFLIITGINHRTSKVIDFFITNGFAFAKWLGALIAVYGIGYFMASKIRTGYWLLITLSLLLSKLGQNLIKFTSKGY